MAIHTPCCPSCGSDSVYEYGITSYTHEVNTIKESAYATDVYSYGDSDYDGDYDPQGYRCNKCSHESSSLTDFIPVEEEEYEEEEEEELGVVEPGSPNDDPAVPVG